MSPAIATAEMDLLIADPDPASVSGLIAAVFHRPPTSLCRHLAADLARWTDPIYVRMAEPRAAACAICLLDAEMAGQSAVDMLLHPAPFQCCRCRVSTASTEGFTYWTERGQITAVGRFCRACTEADVSQAGMVVLS